MSKRVISIGESEIAFLGMERCLEPAGIELVGGSVSAEGALEAIGTLYPDLVLIRLIASDFAGYQLCREITTSCPSLPVIIFVIDPDDRAIADAIHAGARACLDTRNGPSLRACPYRLQLQQCDARHHLQPLSFFSDQS